MRVFEGLSLGAVGRRPFLANRARLGQVAGASLEEYFEAATNAYDRALRAAALAESGDAAGAKKIYDTDPDNAIFWRDTALGLLEDLAAKKAISEADRKEILESVQIPIGDIVAKAGDALARGEIRFWQVFSESAIDRILELVETVKNFAVTRWNRNAKVYNAIVDYIQTATATIERLEKPPSISKDIIDKLKADVGQWKKVKTTIDDSIVAAGLPIEAAGGTAEPMPGSVEGIGYLGPARQSLKGLVKLISGKAGIRTPAGKMVVEEAVEETGKAAKKITTKTLLWKAGAGVLTGTGLFTAGVIFHMSGAGSFPDWIRGEKAVIEEIKNQLRLRDQAQKAYDEERAKTAEKNAEKLDVDVKGIGKVKEKIDKILTTSAEAQGLDPEAFSLLGKKTTVPYALIALGATALFIGLILSGKKN